MVDLEPSDPVWEARFERQRRRIERLAPASLGVFHVGSTAVPGLAAKPCLDVLAVFPGIEPARDLAARLDDREFEWKRDDPDWLTCSRDGGSGEPHAYSIVVHCRPVESDVWRDQLVFRELLRADPEARVEYERAKRRALAAHPDDVEAYTDHKEQTIRNLTDRAYREGYDERLPAFA